MSEVSPEKDELKQVTTGSEAVKTKSSWTSFFLQSHRPVLENEESAWIWFDVANSCYATVALATFLPLVLNSYARTHAWTISGLAKPPTCGDLASPYSTPCIECRIGEGDLLCSGAGTGKTNCVELSVPTIGGVNPTSFAFLVISLSCISQLITFALFGLHADHTERRRELLLASSLLGAGSIVTLAFFPEGEGSAKYLLAALVTVVSNTSFGMAQVFYNAYLPLIAKDKADVNGEDENNVQNTISSHALAGGYWAGVLGLILSIGVLVATGGMAKGATEYQISSSFRWATVLSGVWWFIGTLLTIPRLQSRPSKELLPFSWTYSLAAFGRTIKFTYNKLPKTGLFMILYFFYSDGYSTIAGLGLLYARLDMCAETSTLFVVAMEAPLCAALGNYLFLWISRKYKYSNRTMVVLILALVAVLPFWGLLGYFSNSIGFRNYWEVYLLGAWFGFCLGAIQNFSRTLFIELTPSSRENEYFAFYELTDKGSSWLGPLVVSGLASLGSGTLRLAFAYILFMTLAPAIFIHYLDLEAAKAALKEVELADQYAAPKEEEAAVEITQVATKDTQVATNEVDEVQEKLI